jgi:hypothetical protein
MHTVVTLPPYLNVNDAIKASSIKRTYFYELLNANKFKSHLIGKRRVICTASLLEFISMQPSGTPPLDAFQPK